MGDDRRRNPLTLGNYATERIVMIKFGSTQFCRIKGWVPLPLYTHTHTKNFKLLEYEHIKHHFEAGNLEMPNI